jgi:2-polyprenyl-3-methyl-5-hydroxy-6-metoxy-1,4-benzoquinol methylase
LRLRKLVSRLNRRRSPDTEALFRDGRHFWQRYEEDAPGVRRVVAGRYPLVPPSYVDRYLGTLDRDHHGNPLAPLYVESELGAPQRQTELLLDLESAGVSVEGAQVLDIGCSNGALLLAARARGAARAVGVDVSEGRLASARILCEGRGVELHAVDLLEQGLPEGVGPFDVVFCTDVVEHVPSAEALFRALPPLLAGPRAVAFVSYFNGLHPSCVLKEPHYGVPGMVLLPLEDARALWLSVRESLKSGLDYEVFHWHEYTEVKRLAAAAGMRIAPYLDVAAVLRDRHGFWKDYARTASKLEVEVLEGVARLEASDAEKASLRAALGAYLRRFEEAHAAFEAQGGRIPETDVLDFYLTYYAQPLRFFLRRDAAQGIGGRESSR